MTRYHGTLRVTSKVHLPDAIQHLGRDPGFNAIFAPAARSFLSPCVVTMIFDAIKYVTGGLTFAAFATAVIASVIFALLRRKENLIRSTPEAERSKLVEIALEGFSVDTRDLTKGQKYNLLMHQMTQKEERVKRLLRFLLVIAVVTASSTLFAIIVDSPLAQSIFSSSTKVPIHCELVDRRLQALLGGERKAVESYLGTPDMVHVYPADQFDPIERTYLLYHYHGVDILLNNGKVTSIFLFADGVQKHVGYSRDAIAGMSLSMTRRQIEARFGKPMTLDGGDAINVYAIYPCGPLRLSITYNTRNLNDISARPEDFAISRSGE